MRARRRWMRPASIFDPFRGRDDAREEVGGDDALGGAAGAVDGEGDALQQERAFQGLLAVGERLGPERLDVLVQQPVVVARHAPGREHLVEGLARLIGRLEGRRRNLSDGRARRRRGSFSYRRSSLVHARPHSASGLSVARARRPGFGRPTRHSADDRRSPCTKKGGAPREPFALQRYTSPWPCSIVSLAAVSGAPPARAESRRRILKGELDKGLRAGSDPRHRRGAGRAANRGSRPAGGRATPRPSPPPCCARRVITSPTSAPNFPTPIHPGRP